MRMVILLLLGVLLLYGHTHAQTYSRSLTAKNGEFIGFMEFRPADYSVGKHPLIIFLHGIGERGNGRSDLQKIHCCGLPSYIRKGHNMQFAWNGKKESFVVLMPQLANKYILWESFYVNEMIDYAVKKLNIDADRVFVTGLSLGGGGTWAYASESEANSKRLAGIVPVVGPCMMTNGCNIAKADLPVLAVHAANDKTASPLCTTDAIKAITGCGTASIPNLIMYPDGGHAVWLKRAYSVDHEYQDPNVYEWMLAQHKSLHPNKKPTAKAGTDVTVADASTTVTLSGAASTDPDGKILRYIWRRISGPGTGALTNPTNALTNLRKLDKTGTYRYELKVVDDRAEWSRDTVAVKVNVVVPDSNAAPVAVAGEDVNVVLPDNSLTVDGSESFDTDGKIRKYEWSFLNGPAAVEITDKDSASTTIKGLVKGEYEIELVVTDDEGTTGGDTLKIVVSDEPVSVGAPVAIAGNDTVINNGLNYFVLDGGRSYDPDGTIKKYLWRKLREGNALLEAADKPVTKVTVMQDGVYRFELKVTDDQGRSAADTIQVTFGKNAEGSVLLLYPNPAVTSVVVGVNNAERGEICVSVYDASGRKVLERKMFNNQTSFMHELQVAKLRTGMYYLRIVSKTKTEVKRFVKRG